ncbi:hypothetical protein V5E97_22510 [Singulisphaera sp. Ch08]|uniref:Uncharacterized protein n=1 Tax=Singulisphaera sp. Ch08 TaxID=3120278 RepID=A0AAU7C7I2_9BACT
MSHGFSPDGAKQIYLEGQQPKELPDKLVLARFYRPQGTTIFLSPESSVLPTQEKVLVSLMTPELAPPPPPPSLSATSTLTSVAGTVGPPPAPPSAMPSSTSTPTSASSTLAG